MGASVLYTQGRASVTLRMRKPCCGAVDQSETAEHKENALKASDVQYCAFRMCKGGGSLGREHFSTAFRVQGATRQTLRYLLRVALHLPTLAPVDPRTMRTLTLCSPTQTQRTCSHRLLHERASTQPSL